MERIFIVSLFLLLIGGITAANGQVSCGMESKIVAGGLQNPAFAAAITAQKATLQNKADYVKLSSSGHQAGRETVVTSPIPVVFHIIVDSAHFNLMGGWTGIEQRCDSQIAVLNRDFNRQNADSVSIPSGWKPLYGNAGIQFGLAHTDPNGNGTPGFEVLVTGYAFDENVAYADYTDAKTATNGLAAWDNTRYVNVWCINFADDPALLGLPCPKSFTTAESGPEPAEYEGVCINCLTLGCQTSPASLNFQTGSTATSFAEGRTLTHQMGHFFEIWHTWGDDDGLCPWSTAAGTCSGVAGMGSDDGLADTPPEGGAHIGVPVYTVAGGTVTDCCAYQGTTNEQPIGVACLSFMDATDDDAKYLFTNDQAAAMAAMALVPPDPAIAGATGLGYIGESYMLTQNPTLTNYPPDAGVTVAKPPMALTLAPNPTRGLLTITYNPQNLLRSIRVTDLLGQTLVTITVPAPAQGYYTIDLSSLPKGTYVLGCSFESANAVQKITLE